MRDKSFILGLGIGLIVSVLFLSSYTMNNNISKSTIEKKARDLGMMYPNEIKAFFNNDNKK